MLNATKYNFFDSFYSSLDSHHALEVEASLYAIDKQCKVNNNINFIGTVFYKILPIVQAIETSSTTRLKLISIMQHMEISPDTSKQTILLCNNLLTLYPTRLFAITIIDTLSTLISNSLIDIPFHIQFLTNILTNEVRWSVILISLQNLLKLSRVSPQSPFNITVLISLLNKTPFITIKRLVLTILHELSTSNTPLFYDLSTSHLHLLLSYLFHKDVLCITIVTQLFTSLLIHGSNISPPYTWYSYLKERYLSSLSLLLLKSLQQTDLISTLFGVKLLKSISVLATKFKEIGSTSTILLIDIITSIPTSSKYNVKYLTYTIYSLNSILSTSSPYIVNSTSKLIDIGLNLVNLIDSNNRSDSILVLCSLFKLLFIAFITQRTDSTLLQNHFNKIMEELIGKKEYWCCYKLCLIAMECGYHNLSFNLLSTLQNNIESELFFFWLNSLCFLAKGENTLTLKNNTINCVDSLLLLNDSLSNLQCIQNSTFNLKFQITIIKSRIACIESLSCILLILNQLSLSSTLEDNNKNSVYIDLKEHINKLHNIYVNAKLDSYSLKRKDQLLLKELVKINHFEIIFFIVMKSYAK